MLSVLFISLSKSVFKHSLSLKKSLSSQKTTTLLLSYSFIFMVVQQLHYWKKERSSFDQKKMHMAGGISPPSFSSLLHIIDTIQADKVIWTQILILRRNEADAQKTYTVLSSHT